MDNVGKFLKLLQQRFDMLQIELERDSIMADSSVQEAVAEGIRVDGSSVGEVFLDGMVWSAKDGGHEIQMGAKYIDTLLTFLDNRLGIETPKPFRIVNDEQAVNFQAAEVLNVSEDGGILEIDLPPATLANLRDALQPQRGTYTCDTLPGLIFKIVPTEVKKPDGTIIETIG